MEVPVLIRPDLFKAATVEDEQKIERILRLAVEIRLKLPAHIREEPPFRTDPYSPGCHQVAHAFARVANIQAVDGEHTVITKIEMVGDGTECDANLTTILHSWTEFETPSGLRFILDIFPDEGCPVFPVMYQAPHPAYWIPVDAERVDTLKIIQTEPFQRHITLLENMMREIVSQEGSA